MIKRTVFFSTPGKLSISNRLLCWESQERGKATMPLEDIGFMVIESQQILITSYCLNAIAENGIALVVCDGSHTPSAQLLPYTANTLTQKYVTAQVEATDALKARLWRQTVRQKIKNQASCLKHLKLPYIRMNEIAKTIKSDDAENAEAVAARYYFKQLAQLEDNYLRGNDELAINSALNYGYAIIRAAVARALIGSGLMCIFGIHHANQYNAFGLADDIMEPYRPFVDELVFSDVETFRKGELDMPKKAILLGMLAMDVKIGNEKRPLMTSLSYTTASLVRCFLKEESEISFPEFVK